MPIGVSNFQILDPNQANPLGYGLQQGLAMRLNALQAQKAQNELPFVAPMQQQALQKAIYENMIQKPYAEQAPEFAGAALRKARAEPDEIIARTGLYGQQAQVQAEEAAKARYMRTTGQYDPGIIQLVRNLKQMQAMQQQGMPQQGGANGVNPSAPMTPQSNGYADSNIVLPTMTRQMPQPQSPVERMVQQAMMQGQQQNQSAEQQVPQIDPAAIQQAIQQQPPAQADNQGMFPGTDVPIRDAINAYVRKEMGIAQATPPDPETVKYHNQLIDLQKKRMNAAAFRALPLDERAADIAQAAGLMHGSYSDATKAIMIDGKSMSDIAEENGYDRKDRSNWAKPVNPPFKDTLVKGQQSNISRDVFEAINPDLEKDLGVYPDTIMGYNPKMIQDMWSGKNVEQAAKAAAAVVAANEGNAALIGAAGLRPGLGLMQMMEKKSLTDLKVPRVLMTSDFMKIYRKHLSYYNDKIVDARNNSILSLYGRTNPDKFGGTTPQQLEAPAQQGGENFGAMSDEQLNQIVGSQ